MSLCLALLTENDTFPLCVLSMHLTIGEGSVLGTQWVQETSGEADRPEKEVSKCPKAGQRQNSGIGRVLYISLEGQTIVSVGEF